VRSNDWYVAETLPRAELISQRNLRRQGFHCFCPRLRKTRRHARKVDEVLVPLFPGYVFVRFDRHQDSWRSINGTIGVKRLIGASLATPQTMPEPVIDALLARCDDEVLDGFFQCLDPGQDVRLGSGPFADLVGKVVKLEANGRVRVLLDLLGGRTPIDVGLDQLVPV
jgi:transcriptional antiterminator RfaH